MVIMYSRHQNVEASIPTGRRRFSVIARRIIAIVAAVAIGASALLTSAGTASAATSNGPVVSALNQAKEQSAELGTDLVKVGTIKKDGHTLVHVYRSTVVTDTEKGTNATVRTYVVSSK